MRIFLIFIGWVICYTASAQLDSCISMFESFSETKIDSVTQFDQWILTTKYYPNGKKQDETRVFVSSDCQNWDKCKIKYQHQVYYDDDLSTIALKEGKYLAINKAKIVFRHYGWWYTNKGKEYRRIEEKSTRKR